MWRSTLAQFLKRRIHEKKLLNSSPLILLVFPLLFCPLPWYQNVLIPDTANPEIYSLGFINGFNALAMEHYRLFLIYFLCIIIQVLSLLKKHYLFPILCNFILLIALTLLTSYYYPISVMKLHFLQTLYFGYFLSLFFLLLNIFTNIFLQITSNSRKKIPAMKSQS